MTWKDIHVFDENPEDSNELQSDSIAESVVVTAEVANAIEASANALGEGVHYYPTSNAEQFTYTKISGEPD
jgi:hypothetical protein